MEKDIDKHIEHLALGADEATVFTGVLIVIHEGGITFQCEAIPDMAATLEAALEKARDCAGHDLAVRDTLYLSWNRGRDDVETAASELGTRHQWRMRGWCPEGDGQVFAKWQCHPSI